MSEDLIALTCPQCGAELECDSTEMKITCRYCGTPILIKDFITERRIDNSDRIKSYNNLIKNALQNNDYKTAHKYYEMICSIDASKHNLLLLNISSYLAGESKFNNTWLKELYSFSLVEHKEILQMLIKGTKINMQKEKEFAEHISDEKTRNKKLRNINLDYNSIIFELQKEERNLKPIKCKCKQMLEFDVDVCPRCGRLRADVVKENKKKENKIGAIVLLVIVVLIITIVVAICFGGTQSNSKKSDKKISYTTSVTEIVDICRLEI